MTDLWFIISLTAALTALLAWSFQTLPGERWQIIGTIPLRKQESGAWQGVNLTYYGLFNANAYTMATALVFLLLGAAGIPVLVILAMVLIVLAVCTPASKLVARLVEKKRYTLSVGGASFVGIVTLPLMVYAADRFFGGLHPTAVLAAVAIAYAFGEGIGRIACISFGCCYGKPLSKTHPLIQRLFAKAHFTFSGHTKKIAYADGLDGTKVVPIQAITAVLYCGIGLVGTALFLQGYFRAAFLAALVVTQLWRFISEFFRADYRGNGNISAYQIMGLAAVVYSLVATALLFPRPQPLVPDLAAGLAILWQPAMILFLQALWVLSFLYTGTSQVTFADIRFSVHRERV